MGEFGRIGRFVRVAYGAALGAAALALAGCVTNDNVASTAPVRAPLKLHAATAPSTPKPGVNYSAVGLASWYGPGFHGRRTANGETFDMHSLTAAHPTLPLHCSVRVTNLANHRSLVLRVNDRGPYVGHRVIDVSAQSAKLLGFYDRGLAKVKVEYVGRTPAPRTTASAAPL